MINLFTFDSPEVDRWKGMVACWEFALKEKVPKNLYDLEEMHQNELLFDDNNCVVGINTYNFIRDLQWNNMEKEINAIPDSVFRFWDQKDLMEMLFSCMESNLVFMNSKFSQTRSVNKHHGIIDLMLAMLKVRCSMASSQNEEEARYLLEFCIREKDGSIRGVNSMEEFVKVVKEFEIPFEKEFLDYFTIKDFSELSAFSKIQCYLNIACEYAGNKINTMVDHFMNTAVYACIIEQLIDSTDSKSKCKLHWNQNCILYLERGAAVLMNIEIWKRFIYKRDELFKNADAKFTQAIKLV